MPIDENVIPDIKNLYIFDTPKSDRDRLIGQSFIFGQYLRSNARKFLGHNINSILDMGCGDGQLTLILRKVYPKARVVGVDFDPRAIETAKKLKSMAPDVPQPIEYMVYDVQESLPDGPFELIYTSMVMVHLPKFRKALELAVEKLAPGGYLWVKDLDPNLENAVGDPLFRWFAQMLTGTVVKIGGNPYIGRDLPKIYAELGLEDIKTHFEEHVVGDKGPNAWQSQIMVATALGVFMNARMPITKFNNMSMEDYLAKHKQLSQSAESLKGVLRFPNIIGRKPKP